MMWKRCCATRNYMPKPGVFAWKSCPRSKRRALPTAEFQQSTQLENKTQQMSSMDIDSSCVTSCDTCHAAPLLEFGLVPFGFLWKDRLQGLSPGTTPVVPWWSPGGPLSHGIPGGHAWVTAADSWSCDGSPLSVGYQVGRCREFTEFTSVGSKGCGTLNFDWFIMCTSPSGQCLQEGNHVKKNPRRKLV